VCVHHLSAAQLTRNWYDAKLHQIHSQCAPKKNAKRYSPTKKTKFVYKQQRDVRR